MLDILLSSCRDFILIVSTVNRRCYDLGRIINIYFVKLCQIPKLVVIGSKGQICKKILICTSVQFGLWLRLLLVFVMCRNSKRWRSQGHLTVSIRTHFSELNVWHAYKSNWKYIDQILSKISRLIREYIRYIHVLCSFLNTIYCISKSLKWTKTRDIFSWIYFNESRCKFKHIQSMNCFPLDKRSILKQKVAKLTQKQSEGITLWSVEQHAPPNFFPDE